MGFAAFLTAPVASSGSGMTADTGWVANQSVGDKTTVVSDYINPGLTGSDTVSVAALDGLAGQVEALTKKLQALETALANNLRPNA